MNVHDIIAGVEAIATLATAYFGLMIKLEISRLREYIERSRREDSEKIQKWADEHFVKRRGAS